MVHKYLTEALSCYTFMEISIYYFSSFIAGVLRREKT